MEHSNSNKCTQCDVPKCDVREDAHSDDESESKGKCVHDDESEGPNESDVSESEGNEENRVNILQSLEDDILVIKQEQRVNVTRTECIQVCSLLDYSMEHQQCDVPMNQEWTSIYLLLQSQMHSFLLDSIH